jgi:UDP-N-acetylmuramyl tripeptide synthase
VTVSVRPSSDPAPRPLPVRATAAIEALKLTNRLSRALRRGSGTVAGGRVGLAVEPGLVALLARGKQVALVSGTNGKTTTSTLLATALGSGVGTQVATNATGANMPAGHVAALVDGAGANVAVLEVDEGYLGRLLEETVPRVVVLLNLSRDQLDRIAEVRMLADRWRTALGRIGPATDDGPATVVVANADDPMVAWAAMAAPDVRWVGAGQVWHHDAVGCPACGGRIGFGAGGAWACERCAFARPPLDAWLDGDDLVTAGGERSALTIGLPGRFNRANAAVAALAASVMDDGLTTDEALRRMATVSEVAGRFGTTRRSGHPVRLLLAKNPAGWTAMFDLLDETTGPDVPVVLSINARIADGLDTSWLWDVPFERLAGRTVVVTGDRRLDLAVRLRYAEVGCTVVDGPLAAVDAALAPLDAADHSADGSADPPADPGEVTVVANYTAFADLRRVL